MGFEDVFCGLGWQAFVWGLRMLHFWWFGMADLCMAFEGVTFLVAYGGRPLYGV